MLQLLVARTKRRCDILHLQQLQSPLIIAANGPNGAISLTQVFNRILFYVCNGRYKAKKNGNRGTIVYRAALRRVNREARDYIVYITICLNSAVISCIQGKILCYVQQYCSSVSHGSSCTKTGRCCLKKNQNVPRPSEHCCFSHSAYWLPTRKNTLHGGQSRLWSAQQGKEDKIKAMAAHPPSPPPRAPTLLVRKK